ncbi:MAG: PEP-CTERM sorting domain-containing protein [Alphaproteobacteria bacterium]|nr:MAG: PEP-CTERM sorting domain-containing protein [Alphaproteobacteria bacterium]
MKLALAATALCALPTVANAAVIGSTGGGTGPFSTLTSAGLDGGATATLTGGTVYTADRPFADIPKDGIPGGTFLAAGVLAGQPAVLTFAQPISYLSFLWGSPDTYNVVTLVSSATTYTFTAAGLGFAVTNGDQTFSQYAQFVASAGETIRSISFSNTPARDAFEVTNFTVTAVPEPATWGMMLVGFGMVAGASRYRRRSSKTVYA